jgi:hypothetical protein
MFKFKKSAAGAAKEEFECECCGAMDGQASTGCGCGSIPVSSSSSCGSCGSTNEKSEVSAEK